VSETHIDGLDETLRSLAASADIAAQRMRQLVDEADSRKRFYDIVGYPPEGPKEQWEQETLDWLARQRTITLHDECIHLRAEVARLREALAKVQPLADAAKKYVAAIDGDDRTWRNARVELCDAAENYAPLANETATE